MADETTQTGEETSWWDLDIFADSEFPSTSFDEPLEWPDTLDWGEEFSAGDGELEFPGMGEVDAEPIFPPAPSAPEAAPRREPVEGPDIQWQAAGDGGDATMPHVTVLTGLGGGGSTAAVTRAAHQAPPERLPDSLWAGGVSNLNGDNLKGTGMAPVVTTTIAAPTPYAPGDGGAAGWKRRFDIRHGNAAIIALISFVSLILLGMFMSVRARNQVPDTSQTRTTSDQIQVQGTLNTVPLTLPATTIPPPISIADLVPPAEDATTPAAATGAGAGSSGASSPATTAAPARTAPAGGGGSTATTQPAAQPTNTTAAPQTTAPPETTTPATSPPTNQTTTPTAPRRTTPTFPTVTTVPSDNTPTMPSIPGFPTIPGFPNN